MHNLKQSWLASLKNSSKLIAYSKFKEEIYPETYLFQIKDYKYRKCLAKIRCSNHKLSIEAGRYEGIDSQERLCRLCQRINIFDVEDECHFLLFCPLYNELRATYIPTVEASPESFILLMSNTEPTIQKNVAHFIYNALQLREKLISNF